MQTSALAIPGAPSSALQLKEGAKQDRAIELLEEARAVLDCIEALEHLHTEEHDGGPEVAEAERLLRAIAQACAGARRLLVEAQSLIIDIDLRA
jgi:hypothetical protein